MARQNDLDELAAMIANAIERAGQLNVDAATYILSMALVEVTKVAKAAHGQTNGSKKR